MRLHDVSAGSPSPLGPSRRSDGAVNFAVTSSSAAAMHLCLLAADSPPDALRELPMHRTGDVWHLAVPGLADGTRYGLRVFGDEEDRESATTPILLDPYAPLVSGRRVFGQRDAEECFEPGVGSQFWGTFAFDDGFDWGESYTRPSTPWSDTVIYEMSVRLFTADASSEVPAGARGTFAGLMAKIPHLVELGVTAVELLPIAEYDELEFQRRPNPRDHMVNVWGYSPLAYFAPMSRFAADGGGPRAASQELKTLVRELHRAGIEVLLDVVYNHTAEGGDGDPYVLGFRGLDRDAYYIQDAQGRLLNYSGCGNTVSTNHPMVQQLVVDSLRHWVREYHIDGFRFDLASVFCRDPEGHPLEAPPVLEAIARDPVLSRVKLIAEPWDCGGLYQVGSFPHSGLWAEWNGRYRDDVRRFVRGDPGMVPALATRLSGSADLYEADGRRPYHSINFVIAHDGFTLMDLVSYTHKRNQANGEQGRDGSNDNLSWSCGHEGPTDDPAVRQLRLQQRKNIHLALMLSQGTPMVLMGDEYGRSCDGNNNTYGIDSPLTHFHWDALDEVRGDFFAFYAGLIRLRRRVPLLGRQRFLTPDEVTWHVADWGDPDSRFLAYTLHAEDRGSGSLFVAFNAHGHAFSTRLPSVPEGLGWHRLVDTELSSPDDLDLEARTPLDGEAYRLGAHSAVVFVLQ